MPLQLSLMEEDDVAAFAAVDAAAMQNWALIRAMVRTNPSGQPRQKLTEDRFRAAITQGGELVCLKVVDTDTGELVGGAMWRFQPGTAKTASDDASEPAGLQREAIMKTDDEGRAFYPNASDAVGETSREFRARYVGSKPHAYLHLVVTHPEHQGRGVASLLVRWGCDRADERGWMSVLQASPSGLGVYLKHGFEVVRETKLDLRPYGEDVIEIRRGMIRQPHLADNNK